MIEKSCGTGIAIGCGMCRCESFSIPGEPEVTDQCIQNILKIKPACVRYGMPLMIEPLVFRSNEKAGGYMVDGDLKKYSFSETGSGTGSRYN